jgi:hypothetical protein
MNLKPDKKFMISFLAGYPIAFFIAFFMDLFSCWDCTLTSIIIIDFFFAFMINLIVAPLIYIAYRLIKK